MFTVKLSHRSKRFLNHCDDMTHRRICEKIGKISVLPLPLEAKLVKGYKDKVWRVRVGNYRILYLIDYALQSILIVNIDRRETVYD
ncbi:type II toxin-antitoxin system RelE/ParE family toxin [Candidatus Woesearchaeota archaeon]|nr:type II toxin-antitoxin system RelE/ParE family toxin [Candidatus Woesearchaeota archaeon]